MMHPADTYLASAGNKHDSMVRDNLACKARVLQTALARLRDHEDHFRYKYLRSLQETVDDNEVRLSQA